MPMRWGCKLIQPVWKREWRLLIVQEAVTKTIPKKKKCNKAKWLSEETLQIAEKRKMIGRRRKGKIYPSDCRVPKNSKGK